MHTTVAAIAGPLHKSLLPQIKQQEITARRTIASNPVQMDAIRRQVEMRKTAEEAAKVARKADKKAGKQAKKDAKRAEKAERKAKKHAASGKAGPSTQHLFHVAHLAQWQVCCCRNLV